MHSMILHYYREQLSDLEARLAEEITIRNETPLPDMKSQAGSSVSGTQKKTLTIPAPQEFSLFRPAKVKLFGGDIFEVIGEEMESIREREDEDESLHRGESESTQSESDSSFLFGGSAGKKPKVQDRSEIVRANERLFGSVSLSFFPVM